MSENQEKSKMAISVEVDSKSLEEKIQENINLKNEIEQLKADLSLIAQKELDRQAKIYGCDATVEAVQNAKLNKSNTALLSSQDNNNDYDGFDSTEDAILALNKAQKAKNDKATEMINKLGKKALQKPINYQYEGKLSDIARKPVRSSTESEEQWQSRLAEAKKRQSWRDLNNYKLDGDI